MNQAGSVTFCDIMKNPDGRSKGCALVECAAPLPLPALPFTTTTPARTRPCTFLPRYRRAPHANYRIHCRCDACLACDERGCVRGRRRAHREPHNHKTAGRGGRFETAEQATYAKETLDSSFVAGRRIAIREDREGGTIGEWCGTGAVGSGAVGSAQYA